MRERECERVSGSEGSHSRECERVSGSEGGED